MMLLPVALVLVHVLVESEPVRDSYPPPTPRELLSNNREAKFVILPLTRHFSNAPDVSHPKSRGMFMSAGFTMRKDGFVTVLEWRPSWYRELVNHPAWACVSDNRRIVVTIDTWAERGPGHDLVVYGFKDGVSCAVLADLKFDSFLSRDEIAGKIERSVSSTHWADVRTAKFENGETRFTVETLWGRKITVDLSTGKVTSPIPSVKQESVKP